MFAAIRYHYIILVCLALHGLASQSAASHVDGSTGATWFVHDEFRSKLSLPQSCGLHARFDLLLIGRCTSAATVPLGVDAEWLASEGVLPWVLFSRGASADVLCTVLNTTMTHLPVPTARLIMTMPRYAVFESFPANVDALLSTSLRGCDLISVSPFQLRHPFPPSRRELELARALPSASTAPHVEAVLEVISPDQIKSTIEQLASYHTRQSASDGAIEAKNWISKRLQQCGFAVEHYVFNASMSPVVIGTLKGAVAPSEYVVIGGHYDSRSTNLWNTAMRAPGADDNGSGTAALLEIARAISLAVRAGYIPQYSIRICVFSGEEQGLLGSRAYADSLAKAGVRVIAMFNGDMLGWTLPGKRVTLGMKDRYVSEWLLSVANTISRAYVPELPIGSSNSCCSDHQAFTEAGYPAIGFFENTEGASSYPHYHQSTDLPEFVNFDQVALITKAMASNLITFAGAYNKTA